MMSRILCSELDYRAVKTFLSGLSSLVCHRLLQAHNSVVTCVCQCIFISLTIWSTTGVVLGVSMQLEHLISLILTRVLGRSENSIAHHCHDCCIWNIVRVHTAYFGWCTVCSRETSICVPLNATPPAALADQNSPSVLHALRLLASTVLLNITCGDKKAFMFCWVHLMGQFLFC